MCFLCSPSSTRGILLSFLAKTTYKIIANYYFNDTNFILSILNWCFIKIINFRLRYHLGTFSGNCAPGYKRGVEQARGIKIQFIARILKPWKFQKLGILYTLYSYIFMQTVNSYKNNEFSPNYSIFNVKAFTHTVHRRLLLQFKI